VSGDDHTTWRDDELSQLRRPTGMDGTLTKSKEVLLKAEAISSSTISSRQPRNVMVVKTF